MSEKKTTIIKMQPAFTKTNTFFVRLHLASGDTAALFTRDLKMLDYAGYSDELARVELGQVIRFSRTPIPVLLKKDGEYWKCVHIEKRTNQQTDKAIPLNLNAVHETAVQLARRTLHTFVNGSGVIWDTETTGLDYLTDEIIQFGYTTNADGTKFFNLRPSESNLNALATSPAQLIHGLTETDLRQCPTFSEMSSDIFTILNEKVWVGYNLPFDATLLTYKFWQLGLTPPISICQIDVMMLAAMFFQQWDDEKENFICPKLSDAAQRFGHNFSVHNAGNDSLATLHILKSIAQGKGQS